MNNNPKNSKYPVYKTKKHPIPHVKMPAELLYYLAESKEIGSTMRLAMDCLLSDPFGTEWMPLITELKPKSSARARKLLKEAGFFKFKQEFCDDGSRRWLVQNLHGVDRNS